MKTDLKILIVEDNPCDIELILYAIKTAGFRFIHEVVMTGISYKKAIREFKPDIILSDYSMPKFNGMKALLIKQDLAPLIPFILVTGAMNEEIAVEVMKAGADDYIIKEHLKRLAPAISHALEQKKLNRYKIQAEAALKESETHFRTLANSGQALIWIAGVDRKVVYFNQPWFNFTGRPLDQELGDGWTNGVHPDDLKQCIATYKEKFDVREKFSMEYRIRHADGNFRWVQDDGTPRYNSNGEFIGYIGHCLDITQHKLAAEKIKKYNEQLHGLTAHLERVREEERLTLSRDLHDVFGSSLSGLKMELAILQKSMSDHYLEVHPDIPARIQIMSGQIDDTIGMMRSFIKELRPEILEELGLAETIRWYSGEIAQRSGIEFLITIFPGEIRMNLEQSIILFRIFQEILTNIVQHAKAGKVTVFIKKHLRTLRIKVTDNGTGITEEEIMRNDSFGLLGMKERVFLLHGQIDIIGIPGKGTSVSLTIPVV